MLTQLQLHRNLSHLKVFKKNKLLLMISESCEVQKSGDCVDLTVIIKTLSIEFIG